MELRHLRYFAATAEELNFTRAANRLHISQPAVSRLIKELECELGAQLFTRERFGLRLTAAGEKFLFYARRVLQDCEEGIRAVRENGLNHQKLTIGFISTAMESFLSDALVRLSQERPDIDVTVNEMSPGDQIAALRYRQIDLGFIGNPHDGAGDEFELYVLRKVPLVAVLPVRHRLAGRSEICIGELEGDTFIGYLEDKFPGRNRVISTACARAGFRPKFELKAGSLIEVLGMIGTGKGVCLMPSDVAGLPHPNVAFIPLRDPLDPVRLAAAWLPGNTNPALHQLIAILAADCSSDTGRTSR
ncbi:LysR family transcriptional regulator [Geobacter sulfurreducens]|uniref:LysR family transcriptional regulator n=1 Tax=Geobacter sulfurreducens TaxID=35554 RepID=UPI0001E34293|nr:LysR family transcriptional regulator [Geobacter sulfurreducens]ADI84175.2 helix-turn-helix transcriptional regulator, LysR family [Geobacter sulfurreducens KN400]